MFDYEEIELKLEEGLKDPKYKGVSVELGENWEVIAEIFYNLGLNNKSI